MSERGYAFTVILSSFEGPGDYDLSRAQLCGVLEGIVLANVALLRARPEIPRIYASGARYIRDARPNEDDPYCDARATWLAGGGDCDDLSTWRAADARVYEGIYMTVDCDIRYVALSPTEVRQEVHVFCRRPDGTKEDPSAILGMYDVPGASPLPTLMGASRARSIAAALAGIR